MTDLNRTARALTVAVLAVLATAGPTHPAGARAQEAGGHRLAGDRAAVYNLAGKVTVRGGTGSDVIVAVRTGGEDGGRLEVATGPIELERRGLGRVASLRVVYPDDTIIYGDGNGRTNLRVRDDGTFWDHDRDRGRKVEIRSSGRGLEAHADLDIQIPPGKTVLVFLAVGEVEVRNVDGDLTVDVGSADIRATGTRGRLLLDTGSGNVELSDAGGEIVVDTGSGNVTLTDASGTLTVDTGSGNVDVARVRGESLVLDTGSGNVSGSGVEVTDLRADTGSGGVTLKGVSAARILADTGSGDVVLELLAGIDELTADTGSGNVDLRLPAGFGAEVEIDGGDLELLGGLSLQAEEIAGDYVRGRIGDGRGRMVIDTGSGSVTLRTE